MTHTLPIRDGITMRRMNAAFLAALLALPTTPASVSADPLPGTQSLTDSRDLARVMVDGIHAYLDRELNQSIENRKQYWKADFTSMSMYTQSMYANRERFRKILGVVDERVKPHLEFVSGPNRPSLVSENKHYKIHTIRWDVLPGIEGEGLLLDPPRKPVVSVIIIPDADQTPEQLAGLIPGVAEEYQLARRLAENGCRVIVPVLINRRDDHAGNARLNKWTNLSHREFVHRMMYEMGRTLTGMEVQKILAAADWFCREKDHPPLGVVGLGEGGLLALLSGAIDTRFRVVYPIGYSGPYLGTTREPLDRNAWGLLREFGLAELTHLVAPRVIASDPGPIPPATILNPQRSGRSGAAPGQFRQTPDGLIEAVQKDSVSLYERLVNEAKIDRPPFPRHRPSFAGPKSTVELVGAMFEMTFETPSQSLPALDSRNPIDSDRRHKRQFDQLVTSCQNLWRNSEPVRKEFWKKADASSLESWEKSCDWYREYFHDEIIGKLPKPTMPLNPKSRQIYDTPKWTGHEVTVDVYPDVLAYGILLLPKDLKPGEKRPVVVCQHGLEGRPTDVCNPKERTKYYLSFGAQLADKGYIVFAPQNPYIFDDHFRQILRKANPLKLSLFSFIIRQHERILDWLETQPYVDPKRIAFYGLSYGGKTAMRVPAVEKRYCLSICSGDFNEWIGKIVSTELPMSYMYTKEYDMLEFNLGHTFNYAEMAYLIAPRPFMVERGHDDGVGIDEMVAYEYAKVRYLYANKLKIPDRTDIEFFPGGHQINGKGTFEFLQRHLHYPK